MPHVQLFVPHASPALDFGVLVFSQWPIQFHVPSIVPEACEFDFFYKGDDWDPHRAYGKSLENLEGTLW